MPERVALTRRDADAEAPVLVQAVALGLSVRLLRAERPLSPRPHGA
ncbi:hypothetical protein [Streptomyces sp. WMMC940]|nr:hypothetical protein [Streptomyces sp. WMMC940]MCZ7461734.1 hypothetical protein [Streptomyces sp. WMMC940]